MFKKIWQSFLRWFRKLFGGGKAISRIPATELPPLDDTDREYLFMQLLEGVAHGWQQPRAIGFFNKIRQRVRKSEWLEWLDKFGHNLLEAPVANYELAGRMVQLGQLDCGEIGDLAGDYGARLLNRQAEEYPGNLLPIMEFSDLESASEDEQTPFALAYGDSIDSPDWNFDEVPLELLVDRDPLPNPPPGSFAHQPDTDNSGAETREITLEEFSAMLHTDPGLVAELAEQFGIETTDPQIIINTVVAQMQQQVQQISGDLTPIATEQINPPTPLTPPAPIPEIPTPSPTPPEIPAPIPEIPTPSPTPPPEIPTPPATPPEIPTPSPEIPATPTAPPTTPEAKTLPVTTTSLREPQIPPPPPVPKLEYRSDDPWSNNLLENNEENLPKIANLPDRRGV
jgi:hypothetical protein